MTLLCPIVHRGWAYFCRGIPPQARNVKAIHCCLVLFSKFGIIALTMVKVIAHIAAAAAGVWIATVFAPGVFVQLYSGSNFFGFPVVALWQIYLILGITIGLINSYVKPILSFITFPLRIITLGVFGFFVNMGLIWAVDYVFIEFSAPWFWPLFWTSFIIYGLDRLVSGYFLED